MKTNLLPVSFHQGRPKSKLPILKLLVVLVCDLKGEDATPVLVIWC